MNGSDRMWCKVLMFQPIYHVSVSPTDGSGPTQGQRKTLTRVSVCWTYMETSFISLIKSCLNGEETRLCSITWSRMSMSFSSFSCSNKVKTPYRSAISALLQLGHEVTPKFRENNLLCITCFRTNFEKNNNYEKLLPYFTFLVLGTKYSQFVVNGYFRIRFNFCRSCW